MRTSRKEVCLSAHPAATADTIIMMHNATMRRMLTSASTRATRCPHPAGTSGACATFLLIVTRVKGHDAPGTAPHGRSGTSAPFRFLQIRRIARQSAGNRQGASSTRQPLAGQHPGKHAPFSLASHRLRSPPPCSRIRLIPSPKKDIAYCFLFTVCTYCIGFGRPVHPRPCFAERAVSVARACRDARNPVTADNFDIKACRGYKLQTYRITDAHGDLPP